MTTLMKTLTTVALLEAAKAGPKVVVVIFIVIFIIVFIDAKPPTHTQSGSSANRKSWRRQSSGSKSGSGSSWDGASNKGSPGQDSG